MIYIIEDDIDIRELESYALKNSGYDVKAFADSTGFYTACKEQKPSLVLLDIMLPNEDGLTILQKIRDDKIEVTGVFQSSRFTKLARLYSGRENIIKDPKKRKPFEKDW